MCNECERDVPLENHELGLCASCNYKRRNTDEVIYPEVKIMFLSMCVRQELECPITGRPIDMGCDIHHKMGRDGYADEWARENQISLHIDPRFFLAVTREGHEWIERNQQEATRRGYTISRQTTHSK